jgi:hypothetical protein
MQLELLLADWRTIATAPRTSSVDIEAWNGREVKVVHFAQDLSGEEQPAYSGWFYPVTDSAGRVLYFDQFKNPTYWRPLLSQHTGLDFVL